MKKATILINKDYLVNSNPQTGIEVFFCCWNKMLSIFAVNKTVMEFSYFLSTVSCKSKI